MNDSYPDEPCICDTDFTCFAEVHDAVCTCTELERMTVCHDVRNEPHLVGCPRWGFLK